MSLFKRPAWVKPQAAEAEESDENIFSHSERSYRDIIAEQERKKKEKLGKKQAKDERRSSDRGDEDDKDGTKMGSPTVGSFKRRRITAQDSEALLDSIGLSSKATASSGDDLKSVMIDDDSPVRRSTRTSRHANYESPRKPLRDPQIIELGDGEDDEEEEGVVFEASPPASPETADDSDEEFAELARKARRERHQKELLGKKSHTPDVTTRSPSSGLGLPDTGHQRLPTPPPDPVIQILVSSSIPNTSPLIVHRKLSQRIQEIRLAWCNRQGFSDEESKTVFFVHRMRKIYDATTCRSLGLDVDAFGEIVMKGAEDKEGADKVHLEAVTEDLFAQMKAEKAMQANRRRGELSPPEDPQGVAEGGEEAEEKEPVQSSIRLVLKAKSQKDFKMLVRPNTLFSKIVNAYRKSHSLDEDREIYLEFDGDRLDPDDEVQNTDIQDKDILSVHIS